MITIKQYSHHIEISNMDFNEEKSVIDYCRGLISVTTTIRADGSTVTKNDKVFAERTTSPKTYRLHVQQKDDFLSFMKQNDIEYKLDVVSMYTPAKADFNLAESYKPRDYQEPLVQHVATGNYKEIIALQTGKGKTAVFLFAVARRGVRTVLVLSPKYFDRWLGDLSTKIGEQTGRVPMMPLDKPGELMTVRGSKELRDLINLGLSNQLRAKFIVISSVTYYQYLTHYKENGVDDKYANVEPFKLWELLKVGMVCVDEGHENFHNNFRMDLYNHVPIAVALSATMVPDDPFLKRMYEIVYPTNLRRGDDTYDAYARMLYVPYFLDHDKEHIKTSWRGRGDYSQLAYEANLLNKKNRKRLANVVDMISHDVEHLFLRLRHEDYKLLIFFDSVDMCVHMEKELKKIYPTLKVGKYTSEEGMEVLDELEIIIATTKSADTGIDVKNLQMVFCFVARGSTQSNLQMFGRLRKLKTDKVDPIFLYYMCESIPAHRRYHNRRMETFIPKTKSFGDRNTNFII